MYFDTPHFVLLNLCKVLTLNQKLAECKCSCCTYVKFLFVNLNKKETHVFNFLVIYFFSFFGLGVMFDLVLFWSRVTSC